MSERAAPTGGFLHYRWLTAVHRCGIHRTTEENTKMTAAELEKLLAEVTLQLKTSFDGVLPVKIMVDEVGYVRDDLVETLARKVIAAEKLAAALPE